MVCGLEISKCAGKNPRRVGRRTSRKTTGLSSKRPEQSNRSGFVKEYQRPRIWWAMDP